MSYNANKFNKRSTITIILICVISHFCMGQIKPSPMLKIDSTAKSLNYGSNALQKLKTGGRSRKSIMDIVNSNLYQLKSVYNDRLKVAPSIEGIIKVKFAIDEFGKVLYCQVMESSVKDSVLEIRIKEKINDWIFTKIDKPGDVTEIIYPFAFKRDNSLVVLYTILLLCILVIPLILISQHSS